MYVQSSETVTFAPGCVVAQLGAHRLDDDEPAALRDARSTPRGTRCASDSGLPSIVICGVHCVMRIGENMRHAKRSSCGSRRPT